MRDFIRRNSVNKVHNWRKEPFDVSLQIDERNVKLFHAAELNFTENIGNENNPQHKKCKCTRVGLRVIADLETLGKKLRRNKNMTPNCILWRWRSNILS